MKNNIYIVIISLQLALLGTIFNSIIGINIPLLREIIGFLDLTFIPGLLLLIILKVKNFNFIEWISYSVGLSISFLMFMGLFMNTFYPHFGISKPISLVPLTVTLMILITLLLSIAYFQGRNTQNDNYYFKITDINIIQTLSFCLLPFISIFGIYLLNYFNNNILLITLILIISIIPLLVSYNKIEYNLYPFLLFSIALALLFHYSLVSGYINGYDIQIEHYLSKQVIDRSYWNLNNGNNSNSMLSIVILAPIYSLITSINLAWVYKVIYPLIYAFTSILLYNIYQKQTNSKIAFLSTFFFMSVFTFYVGMPQLARQEIGEIFFVALIYLIFNDKINLLQKSVISVIFTFSLVASHYALSYIFIFAILIIWILSYLLKDRKNNISSSFILLFFTIMLTWYMYTSNSSNLSIITSLLENVLSSFRELLNPNYVQGMEVVVSNVSPTREISKWLHIISQVFIFIGLITVFNNKEHLSLNIKYKLFLVINFIICIAGISVPYISNALNTMRLYHITLIILAPLFVIGGVNILKKIVGILNLNSQNETKYYLFLSLFLSLFLIFNSGIVYEITRENPNYISFNNSIDAPRFTETEVSAVKWLQDEKNPRLDVYADLNRGLLLTGFFNGWNIFSESGKTFLFGSKINITNNTYIFLGEKNVKEGKILLYTYGLGDGLRDLQTSPLQKTLHAANMIYNGGSTNIYYWT